MDCVILLRALLFNITLLPPACHLLAISPPVLFVGGMWVEYFLSSPFSGQCTLVASVCLRVPCQRCFPGAFLQGCFPAGHSPHSLVPHLGPPQGRNFALSLGAILRFPSSCFWLHGLLLHQPLLPIWDPALPCEGTVFHHPVMYCVPSPRASLGLFYGSGPTFVPCNDPAGWLQFSHIQAEQQRCRVMRRNRCLCFSLSACCPESFSRCR